MKLVPIGWSSGTGHGAPDVWLCEPCREVAKGGVLIPADQMAPPAPTPTGLPADQFVLRKYSAPVVITDNVTGSYLCRRPGHVQQTRPDGRPMPCAACDPRPVLRLGDGSTWRRERAAEGWRWAKDACVADEQAG